MSTFRTASATNLWSMFYGCSKLKSLDLAHFTTANVLTMPFMFENCTSLEEVDIRNFTTEKVTDMHEMFCGCSQLRTIYCLNDWTNVSNSVNMFKGCTSLVGGKDSKCDGKTAILGTYALVDGIGDKKGYFTAPKEVYTEYADGVLTYKYDDQRLYSANTTEVYNPKVERFATYHNDVTSAVIDPSMKDANLTSTRMMFFGIGTNQLANMTTISGLENLNTENVTSMQSMFEGCQSLTELDLSRFKTANVTSTNCMFQSCSNLETLNIALFNIGKMEDMRYMFSGCSKLKTIYCKTDWSTSGAQSSYMFSGCSALEGGQGTKFNSSVIDKSYARTDDPDNDKPGYFTVVESVAVTIGAMEWATFVAPYALSFSDVDGLTAYIITGHTGSTVETVEVSDVPANTPVLLN